MNTNPEEILTAEKIQQLASGFQVSRIILSAVELNIFTVLDKKMLHAEEVAEKIVANKHAVERLLNALVALGFLRKTKEKYYNSEASTQFLVKGKPEFMGGLFHSNELWKSWGTLTDAVKTGTSVYNDDSKSDWTESFIAAMHYRTGKEAKILPLMIDLSNTKKMLDVGGGSGVFSMAFIEKNPVITSTIFDLPSVIPISKRHVESFKHNDNIDYLSGNYLIDDIGSGYDLIFLSAIVHIQGLEENKLLIAKCYSALKPGRQIIIKDWIMEPDKTSPLGGAIFSINMLVGTESGDTFTEDEMKYWYTSAGIKRMERKDSSYGWFLMIGYKD